MPTLYDHSGNPIDLSALRREQAAPTLTGIRTIWSESVASGLTPARLARILRQAIEGDATEYLILAEEMEERDLHYSSVLSTRKRAVAGIDPTVEAASDDARDVEIADAVRGLVRAPEFPSLVTDLLDALGKGYSACEIIWDRTDSRWTPREYLWRDPRFFVFDRASMQRLRLLDEGASFEGRDLPPFKFLVHIPKLKSGIPIRSGLARLAAAAYMCKTFTVSDWMAFAEVFGMPLRVGRYGPNATDRDIQTLIRAVANLGTDAACVLPDSMRIEFQEAAKAAGGPDLFPRLAEWLDRQVSKGVLGQTMTSDDGSSQAQANVHDDVRLDIRKDDARQVAATIDRDLIKPYVDLNWGPPKNGYPRVRLQVPEPEDIAALADALAKLVPLGGLGIEASVVRDRLGFPDPANGAVLLGEGYEPMAMNRRSDHGLARGRNRAGAMPDPDAELVELADDALADWEPLLAPVVNPVLELAGKCGSYDEFLAGLPALVSGEAGGGMNADALVRSLAEAAFKARGLGDGGDQ
jgi:phage gp29-like protein